MMVASCPACGRAIVNIEQVKWRDGRRVHPLTCTNRDCPRPSAALEILSETETEHILVLEAGTFSLRHPLRERLPRPGESLPELLGCWVGNHVGEFGQLMARGDMYDLELGVPYRVWLEGEAEDAILGVEQLQGDER